MADRHSKGNSHRRQRSAKPRVDRVRLMAGVFAVLMFGLAVVFSQQEGGSQRKVTEDTPPQPARVFSLAVQKIASKFRCGCGTCDVPELTECTCPTAIAEKELIERELKEGQPESHIVRLVYSHYRHIKPQFASLVGGE